MRKNNYGNYSLDFYYLGDNLLSLFILSDTEDEYLEKSLIAVGRTKWIMKDLFSGKIIAMKGPGRKELLSAKMLGKLAVKQAVHEISSERSKSGGMGRIGYSHSGSPVWIQSPSMADPATNIEAISITHNRNYACGVAIGR